MIPGENAPTGPPQIGKEMVTGWDGNENDALRGDGGWEGKRSAVQAFHKMVPMHSGIPHAIFKQTYQEMFEKGLANLNQNGYTKASSRQRS